ncbi:MULTISPECIES: hormogonium polysaccharide secretion pseudopilin HpsC [unclassified Microcoleus]|uniref:hormogonium polysaccharide secretion pseudopilin HpsC n=1 Tax=unclassified Microcoleus TaxID=2642155 RepID=UPI002FCE8D8E
MKTLLRLLLKSQHQRNRSGPAKTEKGMTLVELLVGAIMAFLIITPMLGFVVDMLNTDRREQVKSNTEQDLQAAVDFIAQDLSQAIYIYDKTDIDLIRNQLPDAASGTTKIPILVFWKRQLIKKGLPIDASTKPVDCGNNSDKCNDTYVLSLVAYYQFKETDQQSIWCQPSGGTCPTRIARYEIRDGVKNPYSIDTAAPYYSDGETIESQRRDPAFDKDFAFTKPTQKVTLAAGLTNTQSGAKNPQVLVNYIDPTTPGPTLSPTECKTALGNPTDPKDTTKFLDEATLKVSDGSTNSFYACVDTARNIARVTIRGNSLRRLQTDANYDAKKSAYFPTATVQVQGLGGVGK